MSEQNLVVYRAPGADPMGEMLNLILDLWDSGEPKRSIFFLFCGGRMFEKRKSSRKRKPKTIFEPETSLRCRATGKRRSLEKKELSRHGNCHNEREIRFLARKRVEPLITKVNVQQEHVRIYLFIMFNK